jgi:hypothetical protein
MSTSKPSRPAIGVLSCASTPMSASGIPSRADARAPARSPDVRRAGDPRGARAEQQRVHGEPSRRGPHAHRQQQPQRDVPIVDVQRVEPHVGAVGDRSRTRRSRAAPSRSRLPCAENSAPPLSSSARRASPSRCESRRGDRVGRSDTVPVARPFICCTAIVPRTPRARCAAASRSLPRACRSRPASRASRARRAATRACP